MFRSKLNSELIEMRPLYQLSLVRARAKRLPYLILSTVSDLCLIMTFHHLRQRIYLSLVGRDKPIENPQPPFVLSNSMRSFGRNDLPSCSVNPEPVKQHSPDLLPRDSRRHVERTVLMSPMQRIMDMVKLVFRFFCVSLALPKLYARILSLVCANTYPNRSRI